MTKIVVHRKSGGPPIPKINDLKHGDIFILHGKDDKLYQRIMKMSITEVIDAVCINTGERVRFKWDTPIEKVRNVTITFELE